MPQKKPDAKHHGSRNFCPDVSGVYPFFGGFNLPPFFEPLVLVERKNIINIHGLFCHTRTPRSPKMSVKAVKAPWGFQRGE